MNKGYPLTFADFLKRAGVPEIKLTTPSSGWLQYTREIMPPGMEAWSLQNEPRFKEQFGDRWRQYLASAAWAMYSANYDV